MVFSSPIFLFVFFPLFLLFYYAMFTPSVLFDNFKLTNFFIKLSNLFLLFSSLLFYFWGESWLVLIMMASTFLDYFCGLMIGRFDKGVIRKFFLIVSIVGNLSFLIFFKYINFGLDSFNLIALSLGFSGYQFNEIINIALPLGISFYTFQSMSYTIDIYRKEVEPTRDFLGFSCYVTMFPQLVAGPIVRYKDISKQIFKRTLNWELFSSGCILFVIGLGKKVLIANTVAGPADKIFALPEFLLTPSLAWLGIVCYTLQIYFDFSGYSDMAIGLGRILGFNFPINFNYPYYAKTIQDFWRRWHISLSSWFRDYLYIPLGGGRGNSSKVFFNLFLVFFLCGLWHGSSWVFVVWGLYHGTFLVAERLGIAKWLERQWVPLRHVYVVMVVMGSWVLFRSDTFSHAMSFYEALLFLASSENAPFSFYMYFTPDVMWAIVIGSIFSWPIIPWIKEKLSEYNMNNKKLVDIYILIYGIGKVVFILCIALFSVMSISSDTYNPFIYFRF